MEVRALAASLAATGALVAACGGGKPINPVGTDIGGGPPTITGIAVTPQMIAPGGSADIVVTAKAPDDGRLSYLFRAQAGVVSIPDSRRPEVARYANDPAKSHGRVSDTVTVQVTDARNVSATGSALVALVVAPSPTPTPPLGGGSNPPTVVVRASGDCHPSCTATFTATATNATELSWSGCASGSGGSINCRINELDTVSATCTARGARGSASASASARGTNRVPVLDHNTHFSWPKNSSVQFSFRIADDDPATTGRCSKTTLTASLGKVTGCSYWGSGGGDSFLVTVDTKDTTGSGTLTWKYTDQWGALVEEKASVNVH